MPFNIIIYIFAECNIAGAIHQSVDHRRDGRAEHHHDLFALAPPLFRFHLQQGGAKAIELVLRLDNIGHARGHIKEVDILQPSLEPSLGPAAGFVDTQAYHVVAGNLSVVFFEMPKHFLPFGQGEPCEIVTGNEEIIALLFRGQRIHQVLAELADGLLLCRVERVEEHRQGSLARL